MASIASDAPTPVYVLTGFLGSGKTTLLKKLLDQDGMIDTIVLMNELGEIALDHLVVQEITEEVVLLRSGCLCCSVRDDLTETLINLYHQRAAGEVPRFSRVVVETTGLADPTPIILTLMSDDWLVQRYRLTSLITTVDASHGVAQLERHREALKQAALADCLVITKADLVSCTDIETLEVRLRAINPAATIEPTTLDGCPNLEVLFKRSSTDAGPRNLDLQRWMGRAPDGGGRVLGSGNPYAAHHHDARIKTFCLVADDALDWPSFVDWLNLLLINRGNDILRVKGLIGLHDRSGPVLVQGVQHVFYPPVYLDEWPSDDRRSRLVFITDGLAGDALASSLGEFQQGSRVTLLQPTPN